MSSPRLYSKSSIASGGKDSLKQIGCPIFILSPLLYLTCGDFESQQEGHGEPVETVVDRRAGKGELELPPVRYLGEGDEGARQAGSDVGAHHHRDGCADVQNWKKYRLDNG